MKNWTALEWVMVLFASAVWIILMITMYSVHVNHVEISQEGKKMFGTTLAAILAILSLWVGSKISKK